jgi:hypothetical protein
MFKILMDDRGSVKFIPLVMLIFGITLKKIAAGLCFPNFAMETDCGS